ncbi:MAG: hypothetical protein R2825_29620 [Saprospiraceae bacterium]
MKNKIKSLFILFIAFFVVCQTNAQDRNVYWLHGFNGFSSHWRNYAEEFQGSRKMNSNRLFYPTTGSIDNITNSINISNPQPQNIGIGHSLGGVICRNFEVTGGTKSVE